VSTAPPIDSTLKLMVVQTALRRSVHSSKAEEAKHRMKIVTGLVCAALLSGCGANQAFLASGGGEDFIAMRHVTDEYGDAEPEATVPVMLGDEQYTYRIWIHKTKPKIVVQTASIAGAAAAGFARGLTLGLAKGDLEYEPFQRAANDYLLATRGPGCSLMNSRKLAHIGWEWDFDCPVLAPATKPRRR
jgi:hypothetical protein